MCQRILDTYVSINGIDNKGISYDIIITNTRGKDGVDYKRGYETHLIVNALMDCNVMSNDSIIPQGLTHTIESYFSSIEATPKVFTAYIGTFQGKLTRKEKKKIIHKTIQYMDGNPYQTMEDDELISIAGYSPIISTEPIEEVNFHMALRYNEYADKTYLWMGSPIITIEY